MYRKLHSYDGAESTTTENTITIPFQEWSDADVNAENWDKMTLRDKHTFMEDFTDPERVNLPSSLPMLEWKRPCELYPETNFVIYTENYDTPHLIENNDHLLKSEFMRSYISSIEILWFLSENSQFSYECLTSQCFLASQCSWRPWTHIYSKCKAGKDSHHNPTVNNLGKYIVRLFWLGSWRKIYVDDLLPVDDHGRVMLPTLNIKSKVAKVGFVESARLMEMWPFILCKALIKIASFTWYGEQELIDFDIIQCLTGWIPFRYFTKGMNSDDVWNRCMKYTEQYQWFEEKAHRSRSKLKMATVHKADTKKPVLIADCRDNKSKFNNFDSEWTYRFLISQTRNIPLLKPTKVSDYPAWKRYRWLEWAARKGLISPLESSLPIRSVKIFDPFFSIYNVVEKDAGILNNEQQDGINKPTQPFVKNTFWKDFADVSQNIKYLTVYIKPSGYPFKIKVTEKDVDSSVRDIGKAKHHIYNSTSEWKEVFCPLKLKPQNNEPLYIFCDSLVKETIVLNLCQTGFCEQIKPIGRETDLYIEANSSSVSNESECGICLTTILKRLKEKRDRPKVLEREVIKSAVFYKPDHPRPRSHIVLTKFNWRSNKQDDYLTSLSTYGSSTILLNLKPGRHVYRLYIKSEKPLCLLMLADNSFSVSNFNDFLNLMVDEPCLLIDFCAHISKCFEKLVGSFGKHNDFVESLQNFYRSCIPQGTISQKERAIFQDAFFSEILNEIQKHIGDEKANHFRILFRKWQNPLRVMSGSIDEGLCYNMDEDDEEFLNEMHKAAQKIQSVFRGFRERNLLKCHNEQSKQYGIILDSLHAINDFFFSGKADILPFIIRNFLKKPHVTNIARRFSFYDHIDDTFNLVEYAEYNLKASIAGWVFICRKLFYVSNPVVMNITLFCDLPRYYIKLLNNDTKEELKYFTKNAAVDTYIPIINGYTLICYGFTPLPKSYNYKIAFASEKNPHDSPLKVISLQCKTDTLTGCYIPNAQNLIAKCIFQTYSQTSVLFIRFATSYKNVKIHLTLSNYSGLILSENVDFGEVIIPSVILEGIGTVLEADNSKKNLQKKGKSLNRIETNELNRSTIPGLCYTIEARVLDNSWPLTEADWKIVRNHKAYMLYVNKDKNLTEKHSKRKPADIYDSPCWSIHIITEKEEKTFFQVDRNKEKELMEMKSKWFDSNPNRFKEAHQLREKYLEENMVRNEQRIEDPKVRSLNPKNFDEYILPKFNLSEYVKDDITIIEKTIEMLDPDKFENEKSNHEKYIEDFTVVSENKNEDVNNGTQRQKKKYNCYKKAINDYREESAEMMAEVQAIRAEYIRMKRP